MDNRLKIGTRKSQLALIQTELVKKKIETLFPHIQIEIVKISTKGDQQLERSLASFGGKGVFTQELEDALFERRIDLAVHSAKDLPMDFPDGLGICAVLEREDPRDVIITNNGVSLADLPSGSILGTSSLRRELQAKKMNPGLRVKILRGNVQTRLRKLKDGEYDAIVMAAAGIKRAGFDQKEDVSFEYLNPMEFLPAAGQGILAVEGRLGDWKEVTQAINDRRAADVLHAERSMLKAIGGGCNAPVGVYTILEEGRLKIKGMYASDGKTPRYVQITGKPEHDPGRKAGEYLCKKNDMVM